MRRLAAGRSAPASINHMLVPMTRTGTRWLTASHVTPPTAHNHTLARMT